MFHYVMFRDYLEPSSTFPAEKLIDTDIHLKLKGSAWSISSGRITGKLEVEPESYQGQKSALED